MITDLSFSADVILGKPSIKSLSDLKGKTVSFESVNSFSHIFVLTALAHTNLDEKNVKFSSVPAMDLEEAFKEGKVDAGHTWNPVSSSLVLKGYNILAKPSDFDLAIIDVLAFGKNLIDERNIDIQRVVYALYDGLKYMEKERDDSLRIIAAGMDLKVDEVRNDLNGIIQPDCCQCFDIFTGKIKNLNGENFDFMRSIKFTNDFLYQKGQIGYKFPPQELFDSSFVKVSAGKK